MIKFSASTIGFYSDVPNELLPEDAIEISVEEYEKLMSGMANGKRIIATGSGLPALEDWPVSPPLSSTQIFEINSSIRADLMSKATQSMTPLLISMQLGDATDQEIAWAKAWQSYCRDLKLLDMSVESPGWPQVPE